MLDTVKINLDLANRRLQGQMTRNNATPITQSLYLKANVPNQKKVKRPLLLTTKHAFVRRLKPLQQSALIISQINHRQKIDTCAWTNCKSMDTNQIQLFVWNSQVHHQINFTTPSKANMIVYQAIKTGIELGWMLKFSDVSIYTLNTKLRFASKLMRKSTMAWDSKETRSNQSSKLDQCLMRL